QPARRRSAGLAGGGPARRPARRALRGCKQPHAAREPPLQLRRPAEVERPGRLKRDHRRATDATARDQRSSSSTPSRNVGSDNGTPINPCPPLASQTRSATFPGSSAPTNASRGSASRTRLDTSSLLSEKKERRQRGSPGVSDPLRQDRQRQPVPEAGTRRGRRRGSEDRHLPRRALPAARPPSR